MLICNTIFLLNYPRYCSFSPLCCFFYVHFVLTLILLTWNIGWVPNNASKWQMGFNWAFKELICTVVVLYCFVMHVCDCACVRARVCVCVCEGFVMCGCFGNMYTVHWLRFFLTWLRFFLTWLRFFLTWLRFFLTWLRFFLPWLRFFRAFPSVVRQMPG